MQRQLAASEAEKAKMRKQHDAYKARHEPEAEEDDEFQDAEEGGGEAAINPKAWQVEYDAHAEKNKGLKKIIANSPCASKTAQWEKQIEDNVAAMAIVQDRIWSSQCPQVQLQQKRPEMCAT